MKLYITIATSVLTLLLFGACEKEASHDADHSGHSESLESAGTKIVNLGDYQAVFDLTTMEDHVEMMKMMHSEMEHNSSATHALTLTLNDENHKPVKGASVKLKMEGPDYAVEKDAMLMEGDGMVHYMADFELTKNGEYTVTSEIVVPGEPASRRAQAKFNIPL